MPAFIDRVGHTYGRLFVVRRHPDPRRVYWECRCDCGNTTVVAANKLAKGHTQSCGCLRIEAQSAANLIHGHSCYPNNGRATKEYNSWSMMRRRCLSEKCQDYPRYGGRGITICERWDSFELFLADMGKAPSKRHSIERNDNDGPYSPDNCRWAPPIEQRRNQERVYTLEHNGMSLTPAEWAVRTGISNKRIHARLKRGWSVAAALDTPVRR